MSFSNNSEGRATLVRSYRNMTVREIRARLEGPLGDAERVTAQAELLRRGAGDDNGPDTTFVTGFAPTSASDIGAVESESGTMHEDGPSDDAAPQAARSRWPLVVVLLLAIAGGVAWALHAGVLRR